MKQTIIHRITVVAIVIFLLGGSFAITLESAALKQSVSMDTIRSSWGNNNCVEREQLPNVHADDMAPQRNQAVSPAVNAGWTLSGDRGHFYVYDWFASVFFNFDPIDSNPTIWLDEAPSGITGSDFDLNGNWYAVAYNGGLYQVDPGTGNATFIGNTTSLNSLVYDTTTEIWYACGADSQGIDSLFTIDISTGEVTFVGHFGAPNIMISLMCDTDGNMYSYDVLFGGNSHLYSIDKDTGEATVIGDMGHNFCYAQEGKFDRNTGILYLAAYDIGQGQSYFATCDPETGEVTILGLFYDVEVDALTAVYGDACHYPHAEFTWTPPDPHPGDAVLFNASTSYDYDGDITLYEWDWNNDGVYEESHSAPTATHSWDNPGNYTVVVRVTDNASLTGEKSRTVHVEHTDTTPPVTSISLNGTLGNEGWYIYPVVVSLTAVDNESGVNYTMYNLDNGTWTIYGAPFTVSTEGMHTVKYYSVDNAGNAEEVKSAELKIDLVPPITTYVISGEIGNNGWYIGNVTLIFMAIDNVSGVNHTFYMLGFGNWTEYTEPVTVADGDHYLLFYSVDHAGNVERMKGPYIFKIDQTPPVFIDFTATPENAMKTKWLLHADLSDPMSGVVRVEFYVDDQPAGNATSAPWEVHYQGHGKMAQAIAYDAAGNSRMSDQIQSLELGMNSQQILNGILSVQQRLLQQP
jgi:hypothetical protein